MNKIKINLFRIYLVSEIVIRKGKTIKRQWLQKTLTHKNYYRINHNRKINQIVLIFGEILLINT